MQDIRPDPLKSKNSPTPTKPLPPLAERLAWPQARHPGKFADQIWRVERRPDQGLVASTYDMAGKTP